jgi:hypothetical protein
VFRAALAVLLVALPAAAFFVARWSQWHHPALLAGLGALAFCSVFAEVRFKRSTFFTPDEAIVTLALIVGGPLPAFLMLLVPDLLARLAFRRLPAFSEGAWGTYASYGWAMLAGAAVLALGHAKSPALGSAPALLAAGLAWTFVNWLIARGLFATLCQRMRFGPLLRSEYRAALPAQLIVLLISVTLATLVPTMGLSVIYPLAAIVFIPQVLLPALAKSREMSRLTRDAATVVYVRALSAHLGARRSERRIVLAAAELVARARAAGPDAPREQSGWTLARSGLHLPPAPVDLSVSEQTAREAWRTALHVSERWDGEGVPAAIAGRQIPKESRLLAIASEWAALTAADGPRLTQAEAILALEAQAATRFDPRIVAAASEIITTEAQFADLEAFQPKLGLLPVPSVLRAGLLPWALRSYAA